MDFIRRKLVLKSSGLLALVPLAGRYLGGIFRPAQNDDKNYKKTYGKSYDQLLSSYRQDKIDRNPQYLNSYDFTNWHREIHDFFRNKLTRHLPITGQVVELGVFKGHSSQILKDKFGEERFLGVDSHRYGDVEGVQIADIRNFADLKDKAALVWNDISSWEGSPRSRKAAFHWAVRNLKVGGIYIDESMKKMPADLNLSGLNLLYSGQNFSVFRKV